MTIYDFLVDDWKELFKPVVQSLISKSSIVISPYLFANL
jgi:hypothetical protein